MRQIVVRDSPWNQNMISETGRMKLRNGLGVSLTPAFRPVINNSSAKAVQQLDSTRAGVSH
jgi:hypothetical protein